MQKYHLTSLVAVLMFVLIPPIGKPLIAVTEREARPSAVPNVFRDVSQNHWAVAWINQLYSEGITGGCNTNPLQFCPEQDVTRAQMAVFILRAIHGASYTPPASTDIFSDVSSTYWAGAWINQLYNEGLTGGCGENPLRFCPEENVTRAQMAVFLLHAIHGPSYTPPASTDIFSDVSSNHWARLWINQLYAENITGGCGQNPLIFCPDQNVTRAQMAVFILRAIHGSTYQPPAIDINVPIIAGCAIYPQDNIWNTPVDTLPVHARSTQWINSIGRYDGFHMDFGSGTWDGGPIGIPYNVVSGSAVTNYTVDFYYPTESDPGPYPITASPNIEYGSDHHILTIDTDDCTLYEIYDASYSGGQWSGGSGAIWDLGSNALRPAGWTSADAAGLPILPGLARYDEIEAGVINHALRFTASNTNSYIWPARHLTSGSPGALTNVPPMGAIFRLKASYDISTFPPEMQVILQAMKTYGIILADNGSDWYVSGTPDERWDNDMLHLLDVLTGDDFEAVDTSSLMIDPDSGATP
ncbi:MAG: S-layer homology domain-containing protein [Chloroflexi bacterium]|nr:S-layer homology domain-containing protein [Chloroflexota bacterium]